MEQSMKSNCDINLLASVPHDRLCKSSRKPRVVAVSITMTGIFCVISDMPFQKSPKI